MDPATIAGLEDALLQPQGSPLVAIDPDWCFSEPVTLCAKQNPWTQWVKVTNVATGETLLYIKPTYSAVRGMFDITDKDNTQLLTVERFGVGTKFDVHAGVYKPTSARRHPCLFTIDAGKEACTMAFHEKTSGALCHGVVEGTLRDHIAVLNAKRDESGPWNAVAHISIPEKKPLRSERHLLEVPAGVDALLVVVVWLARWAELEHEQPAAIVMGGTIL